METTLMKEIKINEEFTIIQGIKTGAITGKETFFHYIAKDGFLWSSIVEASNETEHEEAMAESVADLLAEQLGGTPEVDAQFYFEEFTYNIWIAVSVYDNKVEYHCSTVHQERYEENNSFENRFIKEDDSEANVVDRKTFKGLLKYIERFTK